MSGHSKWANIKRQKQATDLVRGNVFSKLSRAITLAVLEGGGMTDPEHNVKLRLAIEKAKQANMPKDNVNRAIEKGVGPDKATLKEVVYEAFAHSGIALIILATSDNVNRTLSEIRNTLEQYGAKIASGGSITYLFRKCALIIFRKIDVDEEQVLSFAQKINAFDIDTDETHYDIYFPFENLGKLKEYIGDLRYETAEIDYKPTSTVALPAEADIKKVTVLIDALESLDDVHKVYANLQ